MEDEKPDLYYAAPLFNPEELEKNRRVASRLAVWYNVFLPQEGGVLYDELLQQGVQLEIARLQVIGCDVPQLHQCRVLIADLNGATPDYCTVGEAAYVKGLGGTCIGFKTDVRGMLRTGLNPMTYAWFDHIFEGKDAEAEMLNWAQRFAAVARTAGR